MIEKLRRVVLDTNVVVSGFLQPGSKPAQAVTYAFLSGEVIISVPVLAEFHEVLCRPKFNRRSDLDARLLYLFSLAQSAITVRIADTDCRDPRDNMFLELALTGKADLIITGDADLLALHPWRGISILTPAAYLDANAKPLAGPETSP